MSDWDEDLVGLGADVDEPTGEVAAEEDDELEPVLYYGSVDEFVRVYLRKMYRRAINGRSRRWAAAWWKYPEAVARLEALWLAWEELRRSGPLGASVCMGSNCLSITQDLKAVNAVAFPATAEWIVERDTLQGNWTALAPFSNGNITGAGGSQEMSGDTTSEGFTAGSPNMPASHLTNITMVGCNGSTLATTGGITSTGAFTVNFVSRGHDEYCAPAQRALMSFRRLVMIAILIAAAIVVVAGLLWVEVWFAYQLIPWWARHPADS